MDGGEVLFYVGIIVMAAAVLIGIIAIAALHISGKRLKEQLEREFGKVRH